MKPLRLKSGGYSSYPSRRIIAADYYLGEVECDNVSSLYHQSGKSN